MSDTPTVLAIIPARGGSKGFPGKNLAPLCGKPLIAWSIDLAKQVPAVTRIVVSSDSDEILAVAEKYAAEPLMRPADLATDTAPTEPVLLHALDECEKRTGFLPDLVLLLQPTSPLRTVEDVTGAIQTLASSTGDAVISVFEPKHSPWKCFYQNTSGYLSGLVSDDAPFRPRQRFPRAWMPNGAIYVVRTPHLRRTGKLFGPRTIPFVMPEARSADIDTQEDLKLAEQFLRARE